MLPQGFTLADLVMELWLNRSLWSDLLKLGARPEKMVQVDDRVDGKKSRWDSQNVTTFEIRDGIDVSAFDLPDKRISRDGILGWLGI